ncbi:MAG TPA: zf-HC2 domain-containing protein [Acidimicrobiales bacterium]
MRCDHAHEAISARLDGELPPLEDAALDAHLEGCAACREHAHALAGLHRGLRVRPAEPVPDLTGAILATTADQLPSPRPVERPPIEWARYGLFTVAFTQLVLALPLLFGADQADALHATRELGAFGLALAVGMLVVAWQPQRAAGLLPMAMALAAGLTVTAVADMVAGNSPILAEAPHLLELVGVLLLWRLAATTPVAPLPSSRPTTAAA